MFPTLYKKATTGKIQQWTISVDSNVIKTVYGQKDGKLQETADTIKEGKNLGKANETTPEEQARLEAQSQWEKKKKKGYVESLGGAENGDLDSLIEGGVEPMLAHPFEKQGAKIKFPCFYQPKLDGIRCIAIIEEGKASLWTRTRKRITGVPHIERDLESLYAGQTIALDGELYSHSFKNNFEAIVSYVKQQTPKEGHEVVEYHVYDVICEGPFSERIQKIKLGKSLKLVPTSITDEDGVSPAFEAARRLGYEGLMLRNRDSPYENKRSVHLQKVKEFEDAEFTIIGVTEGRGKLQGHAAAFVCQMEGGQTFEAKLTGSTEKLKEYFEDQASCIGKKLTVKYQGLTGKNKVPRFPVGVAIRDYE